MIYELRTYKVMPNRMPALLKRFETNTLRIFGRFGIRAVGYWTTLVGPSHRDMFYMLAWESLEERQRVWGEFVVDPEWVKVRDESEKDGIIVDTVSNMLLAPTSFSPLK
jgi:hypothetical protein